MVGLIPEDSNYYEICAECDESHIPFWTRCGCDNRTIKKIDLDALLKAINIDIKSLTNKPNDDNK